MTGTKKTIPTWAKDTFEALPPGKGFRDKFVFAIDNKNGHPVGCADLVRRYPDASTAMLGLLIIDEAYQAQGIGILALELLMNWMRKWKGIELIRIGVLARNKRALVFWKKAGFRDTQQRKPYQDGQVRSQVHILTRRLGAPLSNGSRARGVLPHRALQSTASRKRVAAPV